MAILQIIKIAGCDALLNDAGQKLAFAAPNYYLEEASLYRSRN
jgi:hypothetical protein